MIVDEKGRPVDYRFVEVNDAFERYTGLKKEFVEGRRVLEIIPTLSDGDFDWIGEYGKIAFQPGSSKSFREYFAPLKRWYKVFVHSVEEGYFATVFVDETPLVEEEYEKRMIHTMLTDIIFELDASYVFTKVIANNENILFASRDEIIGSPFHAYLSEELYRKFERAFQSAKDNQGTEMVWYQSPKKEDDRWFEARIKFFADKYLVSVTDITEQRKLQERYEEVALNYQVLADYTWDWEVWEDRNGVVRYVSPDAKRISGYDAEAFIKDPKLFSTIILEEDRSVWRKHRHGLSDRSGERSIVFRIQTKAGKVKYLRHSCRPAYDRNQEYLGYRSYNTDITQEIEMKERLIESEKHYRLLAEYALDIIWVYNVAEDRFTYISSSVEKYTGFTVEELMQKSFHQTIKEPYEGFIDQKMEELLREFKNNPKEPKEYRIEAQQYCRDGSLLWIEANIKPRYNEKGEIEFVGVSRNVEERKEAERQLTYTATHDQITGLFNRIVFEEKMAEIEEKKIAPVTLVLFDVNGLKLINEAFGNQTGDQALRTVGEVLQSHVEKNDLAARIGGDEFALLLFNLPYEEGKRKLQQIQRAFYQQKIGGEMKLSVSAGWATKTSDKNDIFDVHKKAEKHLYRRKLSQHESFSHHTVQLVMNVLHEKNLREKEHSLRVSELCVATGKAMNFSTDDLNELHMLGMLHDIGKIGIDESILNKPGKLTDEEYNEIKRHPEIGYRILSTVNEYAALSGAVLSHHERFDGKGYPQKLKGEKIPIFARIIAIADAYDAMTSDR
ncbi:MAG TPA: hypothetical protein DHN33_04860, partial [Eubacteriaceae bacterium]|nr:hypothetical protein [Eubacteriaceae bacterium]